MKNNIFFIGAGGIGMAALERYFLAKGYNVAGYDLTPSALTAALEKEGVEINYSGDVEAIPQAFRNPDDTLVVYTPAVPVDLPCFKWFRDNGFDIVKRAKLLGVITRDSYSLCFAGTHGKTTTSSIASFILDNTPGVGCNAFLGGILRNINSNFILNSESDITVVEADEFDRSFHNLHPSVAVITSADPDHLDIYGNAEEYRRSFSHFTSLIKENGYLLLHKGVEIKPEVKESVKIFTYSMGGCEECDFKAFNISRDGSRLVFDISFPDGMVMKNVVLGTPVVINVENSLAAIGAIWLSGNFSEKATRTALEMFKGVERRFEIRWEEKSERKRIIIDDYAHHPEEIKASIASVRQMFPGRNLTVAFQPHLYTRTRDFANEFAEALSKADEVVLVDLYPARELPLPGISSHTILNLIKNGKKAFVKKENFPDFIKNSNFEILLTLGAGDLPNYIPETITMLENNH